MADSLRASIDTVFLDQESGAWFDFDLQERKLRRKFYPYNIYPLLMGGQERLEKMCGKVVEYLKHSGALEYRGKNEQKIHRIRDDQSTST